MTDDATHRCDEHCTCPIHGTPWLYAPASNEHACQNPDCEYAAGVELICGPESALRDLALMASPAYQRAKAAGDSFTAAMNRLRREAGVSGINVAQLRQQILDMAAVGGASPAFTAHAVADFYAAKRQQRAHWAALYPDIAALGNDSPHITIRQGPSRGDCLWSWWSKGRREWRSAP